jgi:hypothetical protein
MQHLEKYNFEKLANTAQSSMSEKYPKTWAKNKQQNMKSFEAGFNRNPFKQLWNKFFGNKK